MIPKMNILIKVKARGQCSTRWKKNPPFQPSRQVSFSETDAISEKIAYQGFLVRSTARDFWKKSPTCHNANIIPTNWDVDFAMSGGYNTDW